MQSRSQQSSRKTSFTSHRDDEKDYDEQYPETQQQPYDSPVAVARPDPAHSDDSGEAPSKTTASNDWEGPNDPDNPQMWPKWQKTYHTFVPSVIAFICTLASSIITPGREGIQQEFGVSYEVSLLPYILYVLGLAAGPLLSAPCSETFGRRAVYWTGMPTFALFTLGAGFSNSIAALSVCRFFSGVFGSPGLSIGSATISDVWTPAERATPMAVYVLMPFLGPAIGPLVGGFVAENKDWRWTMWTLLFFTVAGLTPAAFMKETYKSVILKRRAKKRGLAYPGSGSQRTPIESAKFFLRSTLTRPVHMAVVEPVVAAYTAYVAINIGMLYGFFAAFPYVFGTVYGFDLGRTGLTFLGLGVGCVVGWAVIVLMHQLVYRRQMAKTKKAGEEGRPPPESRLYIAMIGSVMLPVSLFWFGWTADKHVHWISPIIAEAFFGCGNFLIFMSAVLYLMDFYGPLYGASAMAANTLFRYLLGAVFPLFIVQMYRGLGIGWASSLLGFVSLALTPIPWVFKMYGPRLRARSKYVSTK